MLESKSYCWELDDEQKKRAEGFFILLNFYRKTINSKTVTSLWEPDLCWWNTAINNMNELTSQTKYTQTDMVYMSVI